MWVSFYIVQHLGLPPRGAHNRNPLSHQPGSTDERAGPYPLPPRTGTQRELARLNKRLPRRGQRPVCSAFQHAYPFAPRPDALG